MFIRHWGNTNIPMYGNTVEELHLEIRTALGEGDHWVVVAAQDGTPRLVKMVDGKRVDPIIERLKADLRYHQEEAERLTREELDIDTAPEGSYSIEADTAESYHTGRAEAIANAIDLLLGREVKLYSETEA